MTKIKVTHPIQDGDTLLQAGLIYEVDDKKAAKWIERDWCFEIESEPKAEKVKHGEKRKQE